MSKSINEPGPVLPDLFNERLSARPGRVNPNLLRKPPQAARANIHVITIRNVPPDRRVWTAGVPASICALIALGVLSMFQHPPTRFSGLSGNSADSRRPGMQASDSRVEFQTAGPTGSTGQTSSLQLARSVPTKSRSFGDGTVANDTFVDYRHQPSGQSEGEPRRPVIKRVVVYN
jgi:hypothetical protein